MRLGWSGSWIRTRWISIFIGHSREPVISTIYEYRDAIVKRIVDKIARNVKNSRHSKLRISGGFILLHISYSFNFFLEKGKSICNWIFFLQVEFNRNTNIAGVCESSRIFLKIPEKNIGCTSCKLRVDAHPYLCVFSRSRNAKHAGRIPHSPFTHLWLEKYPRIVFIPFLPARALLYKCKFLAAGFFTFRFCHVESRFNQLICEH